MTVMTANRPLKTLDDPSLAELCLNHHPLAFGVLAKRYFVPIYHFAAASVQNPQLAEDITQEVFIRAYRSLAKYDRRRPFKPWLFAIASNVCRSVVMKPNQTPVYFDDPANEAVFSSYQAQLASTTLPEDALPDVALGAQLKAALGQLSPPVRQAFILRHVYDFPYEQVAHVMGANLNTVRTWLRRGRETMQRLMMIQGDAKQ